MEEDCMADENNQGEEPSDFLEENVVDSETTNEEVTNDHHQNEPNPKESEGPISNAIKNLMKKEKEKCPQCDIMVPKKAIRIHMKIKHKLPFHPLKGFKTKPNSLDKRNTSCNICGKTMSKGNISRHVKTVHGENALTQTKSKVASNRFNIKNEPENLEEDSSLEENSESSANPENNVNDKQETKAENIQVSKDDERIYRKCKLCFRTVKRTGYKNHLKNV